jgi:hypothetical protein
MRPSRSCRSAKRRDARFFWYHILKEPDLAGARNSPASERIVAEVFLGLLSLDRDSCLRRTRDGGRRRCQATREARSPWSIC